MLNKSYWKNYLGTLNPSKNEVINLLVLRRKWDDEEVYDFTIPHEVTDYVVSVSFNEDGDIEDITMES